MSIQVPSRELHWAALQETGRIEAARWLLDDGAEIDGRRELKDPTPLHLAIREGQLAMVAFLLERGAIRILCMEIRRKTR